MRQFARGAAALAGSVALLAAFAGSAVAGGWAQATLLDPPDDPPAAGEEREIRFTLLQHGVTPVNFGEVQLTVTHPETGEELVVPATSEGGGTWAATITFPTGGDWQMRIAHQDLEVTGPTTFAVTEAASLTSLPVLIALGAFAAMVGVVVVGMWFVAGRREPAQPQLAPSILADSQPAPEATVRPVRAG